MKFKIRNKKTGEIGFVEAESVEQLKTMSMDDMLKSFTPEQSEQTPSPGTTPETPDNRSTVLQERQGFGGTLGLPSKVELGEGEKKVISAIGDPLASAGAGFASGSTFGGVQRVLPGGQEEFKRVQEERPISYGAGELLGYMVGAGPTVVGKGVSGIAKAAKLGKSTAAVATGAGIGGLESAIETAIDGGDATEVLKSAAKGTVIGGATGKLMDVLGSKLEKITDSNINKLLSKDQTKNIQKEYGETLIEVTSGKYGKNLKNVYENIGKEVSKLNDQLSKISTETSGTISGNADEIALQMMEELDNASLKGYTFSRDKAKDVLNKIQNDVDKLGVNELSIENIREIKNTLRKATDPFKKGVAQTSEDNVVNSITKEYIHRLNEKITEISPDAGAIGQKMKKLLDLQEATGLALNAGKGSLNVAPSNIMFLLAGLGLGGASINPLTAGIFGSVVGGRGLRTLKGIQTTKQLSDILSDPESIRKMSQLMGSLGNSEGSRRRGL